MPGLFVEIITILISAIVHMTSPILLPIYGTPYTPGRETGNMSPLWLDNQFVSFMYNSRFSSGIIVNSV